MPDMSQAPLGYESMHIRLTDVEIGDMLQPGGDRPVPMRVEAMGYWQDEVFLDLAEGTLRTTYQGGMSDIVWVRRPCFS